VPDSDVEAAEEMETLVEEYAKQLEEIAEILENRKSEISQKETLLKELEDTLINAEKELEAKSQEITEQDGKAKKLDQLLSQKKEDLAIQEEELQTSAALQYLSYSMRDEEINRKVDELSSMEGEHVDAAKMTEIEQRLKDQNKEIEELERRLMMEAKGEGGGAVPADAVAKIESMSEELKKKEAEVAQKEEEILDVRREMEKLASQDEKGEARMKMLKDMETRIKDKDKQIKEKEEELAGFKGVLEDVEASLAQKEAEIKIREDEVNLKLQNVERTSGLDSAALSNIDEEVRYRVDAELDVRVKAAEHKMEARIQPLLSKIEKMQKRNEDLELMADRVEQEKTQIEMRELELKDRLNDIAYNEQKLTKRQEMMLKERLMMQEEMEKAKEAQKIKAEVGGDISAGDAKKLADMQGKLQEMEEKLREREEFLRRKEQEIRHAQSAMIETDLQMEIKIEKEGASDKCKTGIGRLDDMLYGGYQFKSNILVLGPSFMGKLTMLNLFIAEGLRKGVPGLYVLTDKTPAEIRESLKPILKGVEAYEAKGLLKYVDAYSKSMGIEEEDPYTIFIDNVTDLDEMSLAINNIQKEWQAEHSYHKVAFHSVSNILAYTDIMNVYKFLQILTAKSKRVGAVSLYITDSGMRTEKEIESLKHIMNGSIELKLEDQKSFLRVVGGGDTRTRAFVEYVHSTRSIDIRGAFSVDHIR
jgi:KaiC/GvpD/RAD55 family RecA-like ATPase